MNDFLDEVFGEKARKAIVLIFWLILFYIGSSLILGIWPFSSISGIIKKTTSAEAIIQNYEWFYDMKGQIDATKNKYLIAKENNLKEAPGIKMVLSSMIAEYNSKSKQTTRNMWKAKDLPYQISLED